MTGLPALRTAGFSQPQGPAALNPAFGTTLVCLPSSSRGAATAVTIGAGVNGVEYDFPTSSSTTATVNFGNAAAADMLGGGTPGWMMVLFNPGATANWDAGANYIINKGDANVTTGWTCYHANNGALTFKFVNAGTNKSVQSNGVMTQNAWHVLIITNDGSPTNSAAGATKIWLDGVDVTITQGSGTGAHPTDSALPLQIGLGPYGASKSSVGKFALAAFGRGNLPQAAVLALTGNPWQVLKSSKANLWLPSSGGNTAALTGVAVTSAVGTLTPNVTVAFTGNSAASAVGTLSPGVSLALTGKSATSTVGSVGILFSVTRTEEVNGAEVNWFAVNGDAATNGTAALTGNAVTTATGTLGKAVSLAITGNATTSAVGAVAASVTVAITGNAVTTATGVFGIGVAKALTGNAVTTATGTLSPSVGNTAALTGNAVITAVGTFGVNVTVALTGNAVTTAVGTPSPSVGATVALTGNAVTTAVGTLGKAISLAITGVQGTTYTGTIGPGVALSLTGRQAVSAVGTITVAPSGFNPASTYQVYVPPENYGLEVPFYDNMYIVAVPVDNHVATVQLE